MFFGIRIDQSIAFQLTKVPRGEDPSAEVPKRGGGRSDLSAKEGGSGLLGPWVIRPFNFQLKIKN